MEVLKTINLATFNLFFYDVPSRPPIKTSLSSMGSLMKKRNALPHQV